MEELQSLCSATGGDDVFYVSSELDKGQCKEQEGGNGQSCRSREDYQEENKDRTFQRRRKDRYGKELV